MTELVPVLTFFFVTFGVCLIALTACLFGVLALIDKFVSRFTNKDKELGNVIDRLDCRISNIEKYYLTK